jgi:hypothetical protein
MSERQPQLQGDAFVGPAGDTPPANDRTMNEQEQGNEGYRRRGRLAVKGEATPITDAPLDAPDADARDDGSDIGKA